MRTFLISALLLSLVSGCSSVKLGPHRIDVQQGNALDQENIARLKTGLNRSQVRFLLGTPLVVDPFRTDRWDYVYVNYKAGKLAEQKRITLFFDGDTLVRIEGDVPAAEPLAPASALPATTQAKAAARVESPASSAVEAHPLPQQGVPQAEPIALAQASRQSESQPASGLEPARATAPQQAQRAEQQPVAQPAVKTVSQPAPTEPARTVQAPASAPAESRPAGVETSVVKPLPNPDDLPPYRDPRAPAEVSLLAETNVERLRPDVVPVFPETGRPAAAQASDSAGDNEAVLWALRSWAKAWSNRDEDAYFAAYDADFVPQEDTRAGWERRRRALLGVSRPIEVKIDSPSIDYLADGSASVIFTQSYRSGNFRDAVVKQVRLVKREEQWLIIGEKVLSVLKGGKR